MKYLFILILGSPIANADYKKPGYQKVEGSGYTVLDDQSHRGQAWDRAFAIRIQAAIAERARREGTQSGIADIGYASSTKPLLPEYQQKPLVDSDQDIDPSDSYGGTGSAPVQRHPAGRFGAK